MGRAIQPAPKPHDSDEHGTHTAGTIAGRPVGGRHVGVAPGARLASAIVIEGGDAIARVLGGMDWALGLGARVLSLSLGFRGWWPDFLAVTRVLRQKGVLPVFAVGNEYAGSSRSPGNYPEALSVGACGEDDRVADFSSSQRFNRKKDPVVPDLVAPGVGIVSAKPGGGYQAMDGTSMATPHVAGLAALLLEAEPEGEGEPPRGGDPRVVRPPARDVRRESRPRDSLRPEGARGAVSRKARVDPELRRQLSDAAAAETRPWKRCCGCARRRGRRRRRPP